MTKSQPYDSKCKFGLLRQVRSNYYKRAKYNTLQSVKENIQAQKGLMEWKGVEGGHKIVISKSTSDVALFISLIFNFKYSDLLTPCIMM